MIIIVSMWLELLYEKGKKALHIKESNFFWRAFQVARTFLLVTFIKVLPEVGSLKDGLGLWARTFTEHTITTDLKLIFTTYERKNKIEFAIFLSFIALCIVVEFLQRKKPVRDYFNKIPIPLRIVIMCAAVIVILMFNAANADIAGGFMYAQF